MNTMKSFVFGLALALVSGSAFGYSAVEQQLRNDGYTPTTSDMWGGGHRLQFKFENRTAWLIEPITPAAGKPWVWTMQWMGSYLARTGAPDLVRKGYYHVHLEAHDLKGSDDAMALFSRFQAYLVSNLGFAAKAKLIGMSWGGFYSVRYANAYPANVERIYLDAPLLNLDKFAQASDIGPWASSVPAGGWTDDPRMPSNMAPAIKAAGIPVFLLYGGADLTVPPKKNCELFIPRYEAASGTGTIVYEKRATYGHHPHGLDVEDVSRIVGFLDN